MKAIVYTTYGPPDVLQLREVEKPVPGDHDVLIRVVAATVTPVDCTFRRGGNVAARLFTGLTKPKRTTPGADFAGVVEAVGSAVSRFKAGDPVFGGASGTHAAYICVPDDGLLFMKPAAMTFEEAAAVPYGALTALPFLRDTARIRRGQRVLINGASGSIGTYAVQLATHFGADVTGVCGTEHVDLVQSLGAAEVIDYTREDFAKRVEAWDVIFDVVGKRSFARCRRALRPGGIYMTTVFSFATLLYMGWTSKVGSKRAALALTGLRPLKETVPDLAFILELIEAGLIRAVIDRRYTLEQMAEAHRYVEAGHKTGNVIVALGPPG